MTAPRPLLAQVLTDDQQEALAAAILLVAGTPEQYGQIILTIDRGKVKFIQPAPSFRMSSPDTARHIRNLSPTPFE